MSLVSKLNAHCMQKLAASWFSKSRDTRGLFVALLLPLVPLCVSFLQTHRHSASPLEAAAHVF